MSGNVRYQETWLKGKAADTPFQRECAVRYDVIKEQLKQFQRPFTVLDIGANMGYFTFRIAEDFPHSTVLAVDNRPELLHHALINDYSNVAILNRRVDGNELTLLASCEVVDVVLALNVLHHCEDWSRMFAAIRRMAVLALVETPGPDDYRARAIERHGRVRERVAEFGGNPILVTQSHVTSNAERFMYAIKPNEHHELTRQTVDAEARGAPRMVETFVDATFTHAHIKQAGRQERDFVPGFNLWNLAKLGVSYPVEPTVQRMLLDAVGHAEKDGTKLDDLRPWNFIFNGGSLTPIDFGHKTHNRSSDLERCQALLSSAWSKGPQRRS